MSLDTYDNLQTAVAARVKRSDLSAKMADYIRLAEARIKTLIDPRVFETTVSLTTTPGSDSVTLPVDFKSPIALWISDINPQQGLDQSLPQNLPYNTTPNRPLYWAIDGGVIRFQCPADAAYPLRFRYQQTFALSDAIPTNTVLRDYPDVYFFGTLCELADDIFDDANQAKWDAKFRDAVQRANDQEGSNHKFVPLVTEFGQIMKRRFNIFRGY